MDAIEYLTSVAVVEACRSGWPYRVERSDRSEAVYVKVLRDGHWRGLRIASHTPFYRCSADYEQVLVPRLVEGVTALADAEAAVVAAVRAGGTVVADPEEVHEALFRAWRDLRHGVEREGAGGTRWRWDETSLRWKSVSGLHNPGRDGDEADLAPTDPPRQVLRPGAESDVRHRLNVRAVWAFDEQAKT